VETSTFLLRHQASRNDWQKSSLPPPTRCRVELEIDLAHPSDIVLQKIFVQGVNGVQRRPHRSRGP